MLRTEDIVAQQEILTSHRRRLTQLLKQQAILGAAHAPPAVAAEILEARSEIKRVKEILQGWGVSIEDHPDDSAAPEQGQARGLEQLPAPTTRAGLGLEALVELMRVPEAHEAVAVYRASFADICHQIAVLGSYKMLHDLFQELEDRHDIVMRFCRDLTDVASTWNDVEDNEPELYVKADELLEFAGRAPLAADTAIWTQKLSRAQHDMRAALESHSPERFKDAVGRLKEVVDRQISRINTRLASAAHALRLATLVASLRTVSRQIAFQIARLKLGDGAARQLADFRQGVDALAELDSRLIKSVELHTAFQEFDDELRRVESLFAHDLGELIDAWQDLGPMMRALCDRSIAEWSIQLARRGDELKRALDMDDRPKIIRAFKRYRAQATQSFNRVDYDLFELCTELESVGNPLNRILKLIQPEAET